MSSFTMEVSGTIQMETDTVTMQTALELICSPTIRLNGTIRTVTVLGTMATGLQVMERNGKMMTTTDMVTIQMEPMVTNI